VIVRDLRGESRHQVTIDAKEAEHWAKLGAEPSRCAEAVMRSSSIASRRNRS
jgi:ribosomal protein S16